MKIAAAPQKKMTDSGITREITPIASVEMTVPSVVSVSSPDFGQNAPASDHILVSPRVISTSMLVTL